MTSFVVTITRVDTDASNLEKPSATQQIFSQTVDENPLAKVVLAVNKQTRIRRSRNQTAAK